MRIKQFFDSYEKFNSFHRVCQLVVETIINDPAFHGVVEIDPHQFCELFNIIVKLL